MKETLLKKCTFGKAGACVSSVNTSGFVNSQNIDQVNLKIIHFHYLKIKFLDQSISKTFYLIKKMKHWYRQRILSHREYVRNTPHLHFTTLLHPHGQSMATSRTTQE